MVQGLDTRTNKLPVSILQIERCSQKHTCLYILKGNSLNNMCHSVQVYQATILMSEIEAY